MEKAIKLQSTITCPDCGFQKEESMPTNACTYFYKCTNCEILLKPKQGDCCVFCSYGSVKCPPTQAGVSYCASKVNNVINKNRLHKAPEM